MNTAKLRLVLLSNKTAKGAVKRICESLIEMADSIPDKNLSEIALDKLSPYNTELVVKSYISNEKRLLSLQDMGIKESSNKILQESEISKYPHLKGPIANFKNLSEINPDYLLIESYINVLRPLVWEPIVKSELQKLEEKKNELAEDILVKSSIDIIKGSRNSFIYTALIEKLENYLTDRTTGSRKLMIQELDRYRFDTNINKLANNLRLIENSFGGFNMLSNTTKCTVKPSVGFVDIKESVDYFLLDGAFYKKSGAKISSVNESEIMKNSPSLHNMARIAKGNNFSIQGENIVIYGKNDTIKINESGSISINDNPIHINELKHKAAISTLIDPSYNKTLQDVIFVHENIDKFMEIDFSKSIVSNIYEGLKVNVVKGDTYVVNYVNPAMNENRVVNFSNATQLKNFIWDSLSYDISESFTDVLTQENKETIKLQKTSSKILEQIVNIEKELAKIDIEKAKDESLNESKLIIELEDSLREELSILKKKYTVASSRINEAAASSPIPSVGDTVKVRTKGTGTVLSVDGVDRKFIILLNNGETIQCIDKDIDILETMVKKSKTSSPEVDMSLIQGSNARPSSKNAGLKKHLKESELSEEIDTVDDVVSISMDDVEGMTGDPSNVVTHPEFGEAYDNDIEFFNDLTAKGRRDYYPEDDQDDMSNLFAGDDDSEEEIDIDIDLESDEVMGDEDSMEEGMHMHDDMDEYEMEEYDDYDYGDDYEMEEYDDYDMEEDISSDELDMEEESEMDLHDYERKSKMDPGYGSRQVVLRDDTDDEDGYDYDSIDIQYESEDDDELSGSHAGAIEEV